MEYVLPENSLTYKSFCPYCLEDFDLERHKPYQKKDGCGHTLCAACVRYMKRQKMLEICPACQVGAEPKDGEYEKHQVMINNLPHLKRITAKNQRMRYELDVLMKKNVSIKRRFAELSGKSREDITMFRYVPEVGVRRPSEIEAEFVAQGGNLMDFKVGRWQFFEIQDAIENLEYDNRVMMKMLKQLGNETSKVRLDYARLMALKRPECVSLDNSSDEEATSHSDSEDM